MNKKMLLLLATLAIGSGAVYLSQFYPEYAEVKKLEGLLERQQRYSDIKALDELNQFPAERLRVLAEKGYAVAQYRLADVYDRNRQKEIAQRWFKKAADQNYAEAYVSLANTEDKEERRKNLEKAMELGSQSAKFELAMDIVINERDDLSTIMLLEQGAEAGYPRSQAILGQSYFYGFGVKQNWEKAFKWFERFYQNVKINNSMDIVLSQYSREIRFGIYDIYIDLAILYLLGKDKNEIKAMELIKKCNETFICGNRRINDLIDLKLDIISRTDLPDLPEIQQAVESLKEELVLSKDPKALIGLGKLEKDKTKAKQYFGDACDLRSQEGCDKYRELNQQENK